MSNKPYWLEILEEAMLSNEEFEDIIITAYGYVGISEKKAAIKLDFDCVRCGGTPRKEGEAELDVFLLPNDKVKVVIKDIKITCPEKGYHIHKELNKRIKAINKRSKWLWLTMLLTNFVKPIISIKSAILQKTFS